MPDEPHFFFGEWSKCPDAGKEVFTGTAISKYDVREFHESPVWNQ